MQKPGVKAGLLFMVRVYEAVFSILFFTCGGVSVPMS
jgi:hypothetical protein